MKYINVNIISIKKIFELNSNYYNCTDGMSDELHYGIIKYIRKEKTFIIIDRNRTIKIYRKVKKNKKFI